MRIIRGNNPIDQDDRGTVAALGNFDGVHLGHQSVIQAAGQVARELGAPLSVLTFEPHPRMLFQQETATFRLSTTDTRAEALADIGVETLFELAFDQDFSQLAAEDFVPRVLGDMLGLRHVVCGYDFVFGHRRRGNPELLESQGREHGIGVTRMDAVTEEDGAVYSSTRVRQCIAEGDPRGATELLGRPWNFTAVVEQGDQRGRTIGFPTCNLRVVDLVQPAHGVYAIQVRVADEGVWLPGVANFGRRPTVNDRGPLFEAHLFDVDRDLYDKALTIRVIDFIRPEMRFSGLEALTAQIAADATRAREILAE
ncbi:MAG: bifunctional riboflavin kinase/FAD synthetase [Alphaproteobacteria bacterium]|nr:bifunctional riboflavin kinase/FAD synthetase [Alphaproteobacteria bacterium]